MCLCISFLPLSATCEQMGANYYRQGANWSIPVISLSSERATTSSLAKYTHASLENGAIFKNRTYVTTVFGENTKCNM